MPTQNSTNATTARTRQTSSSRGRTAPDTGGRSRRKVTRSRRRLQQAHLRTPRACGGGPGDEERRAEERDDDAGPDLAGPRHDPAEDVRGQQQARREHRGRAAASGGPGRSTNRTACGTIRPRNTIGPATATAAPVSRVIASAPRSRIGPSFRPSAIATSSPRARLLSAGPRAIASTTPATRNGRTRSSAAVHTGERAGRPEAVAVERHRVRQHHRAGEDGAAP